MQRWSWIMALALASSVPLIATTAQADEKNEKHEKVVKLEEIPAPAQATIKREAGTSPILKVEEERDASGKVLYEAHVRQGKDVLGITVDPSGKLIGKHPEKAEKKEKK